MTCQWARCLFLSLEKRITAEAWASETACCMHAAWCATRITCINLALCNSTYLNKSWLIHLLWTHDTYSYDVQTAVGRSKHHRMCTLWCFDGVWKALWQVPCRMLFRLRYQPSINWNIRDELSSNKVMSTRALVSQRVPGYSPKIAQKLASTRVFSPDFASTRWPRVLAGVQL